MTAAQHEWHVAHYDALNELLLEYLVANPARLRAEITTSELHRWLIARVLEPVNEPAVCSHCGEACSEGHVCERDITLKAEAR